MTGAVPSLLRPLWFFIFLTGQIYGAQDDKIVKINHHVRSKSLPMSKQKENSPPSSSSPMVKSADRMTESIVQILGRLSLEDERTPDLEIPSIMNAVPTSPVPFFPFPVYDDDVEEELTGYGQVLVAVGEEEEEGEEMMMGEDYLMEGVDKGGVGYEDGDRLSSSSPFSSSSSSEITPSRPGLCHLKEPFAHDRLLLKLEQVRREREENEEDDFDADDFDDDDDENDEEDDDYYNGIDHDFMYQDYDGQDYGGEEDDDDADEGDVIASAKQVGGDGWRDWSWAEGQGKEEMEEGPSSSFDEQPPSSDEQPAYSQSVMPGAIKPLFSPEHSSPAPSHAMTPASSRRSKRKFPPSLVNLCRAGAVSEFYHLDGMLGKGSYGSVYRAHSRRNPQQLVAIKIIKLDRFQDDQYEYICGLLEKELRTLPKLLGFPKLLQLQDVIANVLQRRLSIVTELIEGYSLADLLDWIIYRQEHPPTPRSQASVASSSGQGASISAPAHSTTISSASSSSSSASSPAGPMIPVRVIGRIVKDLLQALQSLHALNIAHFDLKSANVMIRATGGETVLVDFGMSHEFLPGKPSTISDLKGTPSIMAPEMLLKSSAAAAGLPADLWSLGITVAEMVEGYPPIQANDIANAVMAMSKFKGVSLPRAQGEPLLVDFITLCLCPDPQTRPTAAQLLAHPFIQQQVANDQEMAFFMQQMEQLKTLFGGKRTHRPVEDPITPASKSPKPFPLARHHKSA